MTSCCGLKPLRGEGEYPTYIACNLCNDIDMTYVPWSGWMDDRFPKITQNRSDGEECMGYIANMRPGTMAGFKYFDIKGLKRIGVTTKGYAHGVMEVRTAWDGPVVCTIPLNYANVWQEQVTDISVEDGVKPLYFTFRGDGFLQFASFRLITD